MEEGIRKARAGAGGDPQVDQGRAGPVSEVGYDMGCEEDAGREVGLEEGHTVEVRAVEQARISTEEVEESLLDTQGLVEAMEDKLQEADTKHRQEVGELHNKLRKTEAHMEQVVGEKSSLLEMNTALSSQVTDSLHSIHELQNREDDLSKELAMISGFMEATQEEGKADRIRMMQVSSATSAHANVLAQYGEVEQVSDQQRQLVLNWRSCRSSVISARTRSRKSSGRRKRLWSSSSLVSVPGRMRRGSCWSGCRSWGRGRIRRKGKARRRGRATRRDRARRRSKAPGGGSPGPVIWARVFFGLEYFLDKSIFRARVFFGK
jgi:hypothetical protein